MNERGLLKKVYFPREAPIPGRGAHLPDLALNIAIITMSTLLGGWSSAGWQPFPCR